MQVGMSKYGNLIIVDELLLLETLKEQDLLS